MSTDLLERAKRAVMTATKRGAQGVRASAYRSRESTVEWRNGRLERVRESTQMGLSVTLFVDGRSSNTTSDLRPEALERFLEETVAQTRLLAADPFRSLPDPARYAGRTTADLEVLDAGVGDVAPTERRRIVRELEDAARSAPENDRIISVSSSSGDDLTEGALVASNGMEGTMARSTFWTEASVSVRDAAGRKPEGSWWAVACRRGALPSVESVGREATRRAVALLGSKPARTGEYACVVENAAAGRLLYALFQPLDGFALQQRRSFLAGKVGQAIASPCLTVTDDPHLRAGLGSRAYDGEGVTTRPRPIFERGVLRSYYLDTYYARKLKLEPTSGTRTNLVYAVGTRSLEELLKAMGRGILVTGFIGGNSNSATGDFSFGIRGHLVERGRIASAVSEMNLSGNHLTFWKRLQELGNDPYPSSSNCCPSLRFDTVQFSGT